MVEVAGGEVVRVSFPRLVPQPAAPVAPAPEPASPPRRTADVIVTPWPVAAAAVPDGGGARARAANRRPAAGLDAARRRRKAELPLEVVDG